MEEVKTNSIVSFKRSMKGFLNKFESFAQTSSNNVDSQGFFGKIRSKFPFNKINKTRIKIFAYCVIILAVVLLLLKISGRNPSSITNSNSSSQKTVNISKTYQFSGQTEDGKDTENFLTMNLVNAEMTKQILIQGKPATAKAGKIFLIINLEINNSHSQKLFLSPVDLIRLVDKDGKKFAPDVHNNQVSVEPISVKKTRVGFVIDEGVSGWRLQIGEVAGSKETISLPI